MKQKILVINEMKQDEILLKPNWKFRTEKNFIEYCELSLKFLAKFYCLILCFHSVAMYFVDFLFRFHCFQKLTAKFQFRSNRFKILKFQTWLWRKLKKSVSQLPTCLKGGKYFFVEKASYLIELVQGGQRYWAFPFNKGSLAKVSFLCKAIIDSKNRTFTIL